MTAWYNEHDPYAAAWLRNLIIMGHIAEGDVDERSIEDVRPSDLQGYSQCHFFAGIGVWSYALRCAGWPDDRAVWTGSCPCQPYSAAGKGKGFSDERHLWPAWFHLISQCSPDVVFGEQVASKDALAWFDLVHLDMEAAGYAGGAVDLCAAGVGAPHIRQRLWLAYANQRAGGQGRADIRGRTDRGDAGPRPGFSSGSVFGGLADASSERRIGRKNTSRSLSQDAAERSESKSIVSGGQLFVGLANHDINGCGADAERKFHDAAHHAESCGEAGQRAGPTNGFWRAADWLLCRDGRWRPVEPGFKQMVDGSAQSLGPVRASAIKEVEEEINAWAIRHQKDPGEALRDVWRSLSAEALRVGATGGLSGVHEAPILLAFVRQLADQGWTLAQGVSRASPEAAQTPLRVLRHEQAAGGASRQRGLDEQQLGESPDPVHFLSHLLARHASAAWSEARLADACDTLPLAVGARSRVGRLRAYGNAINAEAAREFIEAVMECRP